MTSTLWPLRSLLFVPANREDFIQKAPRYAPEAVILDLEDSVPRALRDQARRQLDCSIQWLVDHSIAPFVRINSFDDGGTEDIAAFTHKSLRGVIVPKLDNADQVRHVDSVLSYHEGRQGMAHRQLDVIALPETARGLCQAYAIASASSRVKSLMTALSGPVGGDVAYAAGIVPTLEGHEQIYLASKIVLDSRAAGATSPIAGILSDDLRNLDRAAQLISRSKALGFSGVALMHPAHVALAHAILRPSIEEVVRAREMVHRFELAQGEGRGSFSFGGAMVDQAMLARALDTLREAERTQGRA